LNAFAVPVMLAMLGLLVTLVSGAAPPAEEKAATPAGVEMNEAERAFSESLTGAALTGRFTVDGDPNAPKEERYEVVAATKVGEHDWVIVARIVYGQNDIKVPVPVKIHWAGDTPVLSLTDLAIPGLGTFTSRVMFYGDRYAGTWQHGDKGGHLFGGIAKPEAGEEKAEEKTAE
jgi:hypothetical protein